VINRPLAFLDTSRELRLLTAQAQQLRKLQRQYAQIVPAALKPSSQVLRLDQTVLTIAANNGATAAKLRHISHDLIESFQQFNLALTEIKIKVQVDSNAPAEISTPRLISNEAGQELSNLADRLQDSPLKSALKRLALKSKPAK
jgi:hypothetical protein